MFAGNFAPRDWAFCDGQLFDIAQNVTLFSLLGTIYGGDGRTSFGLPDLRGRIPIHAGNGPGLNPRQIGEKSGVENVTLNVNQLPSHTHIVECSSGQGTAADPTGRTWGAVSHGRLYSKENPQSSMSGNTILNAGGGQPHNNTMPFICINFIIALVGIFPSRN